MFAILGSSNAGKSSLIGRHVHGDFGKGVKIRTGTITLWDHIITYTDAVDEKTQGVILVFDTTDQESFKVAKQYLVAVRTVSKTLPIVICGNKFDKLVMHDNETHDRVIDLDELRALMGDIVGYFDTSAASNYNIGNPEKYLISKIQMTSD